MYWAIVEERTSFLALSATVVAGLAWWRIPRPKARARRDAPPHWIESKAGALVLVLLVLPLLLWLQAGNRAPPTWIDAGSLVTLSCLLLLYQLRSGAARGRSGGRRQRSISWLTGFPRQVLPMHSILLLAAFTWLGTTNPPLALFLSIGAQVSTQVPFAQRLWSDVGDESTGRRHSGGEGFGQSLFWFATGLLVLILAMCIVESVERYYFVQDDNLAQFLPVMLEGCRSAAEGRCPNWNPYQYLGSPTASVGTYALTYPPTYLSYWIAKAVLGDEYAMLDVFCIGHVLAGYAAVFWCIRRWRVASAIAAVGGLSVVLGGYNLIAGRSWYYMVPVPVFAALLVGLSQVLLLRGPSLRWWLAAGATIGAFFHAGNAQMWAYAMLCLAVWAITLTLLRKFDGPRLVALGAACLLGIALSCPLLVPQFLVTAGIVRSFQSEGISPGLWGMLVPHPFSSALHPCGWGATMMMQFYYSGTVFVVASLFGAVSLASTVLFKVARNPGSPLRSAPDEVAWFVVGMIVFLLAVPAFGVADYLHALPVFRSFKFPFKFLGLLNLFMALCGSLFLARLLRCSSRGRKVGEAVVFLIGCGLLLYHVSLCRCAFWEYGFRPYPRLPSGVSKRLFTPSPAWPQRVLPLGPARESNSDYYDSLLHNFPTVQRCMSAAGYDPLVEEMPVYQVVRQAFATDPLQACRIHDVRWIATYDYERPKGSDKPVYPMKHGGLFEVARPDPFAFFAKAPSEALRVAWHSEGVDVTVPSRSSPGTLVVNVFCWPEITATDAAGNRLAVQPDVHGRVTMQLTADVGEVHVRYCPPWGTGCACGAALLLASLLAMLLSLRFATISAQRRRANGRDTSCRPRRSQSRAVAGRTL
jgi:hypothetical protein